MRLKNHKSIGEVTGIYRIAVCDDDRVFGGEITKCVSEYFDMRNLEVEIIMFCSGESLLESGNIFDLIFLDYEMGSINGFDVAREINKKEVENTSSSKIMFITNHSEVIREAFRVKAYRFMYKEDFQKDLGLYLNDFIEDSSSSFFEIMVENTIVKMRTSEIQFITARHNGSEVWIKNINGLSELSLESWLKVLDCNKIISCHKSNIVNIRFVDYIDNYIHMYDGSKILYSRRKKAELMQKYKQYIFNCRV